LAIGIAVLAAAGGRARRGITDLEERVFRLLDELPDGALRAIWVPMQYGTFGIVPSLSGLALARRRGRLALASAMGGTAAWALAKAVKPVVGRGRPADVLTDVTLRGREEGDLGFPSGHAAVSAAITVILAPHASHRRWLLPVALCAFVPVARIYVGAHLPLDVIGGSALGLAVGSAVNLAVSVPLVQDAGSNA
jgi:membrane-associated phospholipid phosphatase